MKNKLQKILSTLSIPFIAGGIANAAFADSNSQGKQDNQGIILEIPNGRTIDLDSKDVYDMLATADDVLHGLHVEKFINEYNGVKTTSYGVLGSLDRAKIADWQENLGGLAELADANHNSKVSLAEASGLLLGVYIFEYNKQNKTNNSKI